MEYRQLTKSGLKVSCISFGGMRLPEISEEEAFKVVNKAIDLGINFFETASGYGDSELKIGKALGKRRKDIFLSSKNAYNDPITADDLKRQIEEQLKRLKTDYLDFYQMWGTDSMDVFVKMLEPGYKYEGVKDLMKQGVIRHLGMTSHGKPKDVEIMLESGLFESVTLYYNAYQQQYAEVAALAKKLNMGVVAMGPLNGGFLGEETGKLSFLKRGKAKTNAQGALRFIVGNKNITTSIVGFKTEQDVIDGAAAGDFYEDIAGTSDMAFISEAFKEIEKKIPKSICSACDYCKPCKEGINISHIFKIMNDAKVYDTLEFARERYKQYGQKGALCSKCGACMEKCPQKLDIIKDMAEAHELLKS
ncbi:MAG: aldo/keto reductase [Candidatus Firestonebacteria bacterium]